MNIFISYSSKNRPLIAPLEEDLTNIGHNVWYDQELSGGQVWWDQILHNIRECDLFIFALTPESLASYPCKLEYGYAAALGKNVLPIVLKAVNTTLLPPELSILQFVDYRKRDRESLISLTRALGKLPAVRPLPDLLPVPPDIPISPLGKLNQRIQAAVLSADEQAALLFELKEYYGSPATRNDARQLLLTLKSHPDLRSRVEYEIDELLGARERRSGPQPSAASVRRGRFNGVWLLAIISVIGAGAVIAVLLSGQFSAGNNPALTNTPTKQTSTAIVMLPTEPPSAPTSTNTSTEIPTENPTATYTATYTATKPLPTATPMPSKTPTNIPTKLSTKVPTKAPTKTPTTVPTREPTIVVPTGLKIGLVTATGPLDDRGINQSASEAMLATAAELGVESSTITSTGPETYLSNIQILANERYTIIVTVGFALSDATAIAADQYPDIYFIGIDQYQSTPRANVTGLIFAEDQAGFLAGILAAKLSKRGTVAAVLGTNQVPAVLNFGQGYEAGAKYINPDIRVISTYHNGSIDKAFTDPDWGASMAKEALYQGADVVFGAGGNTGNGAIQEVAKSTTITNKVYCIGVDTDQWDTLPEARPCLVSSAMKLVYPSISRLIKQVVMGTVKSGNYYGEVGLAPFHNFSSLITSETQSILDAAKADLASGKLKVSP